MTRETQTLEGKREMWKQFAEGGRDKCIRVQLAGLDSKGRKVPEEKMTPPPRWARGVRL